ncbi:hypothetical protein JXJ21_17515 [candidate division KSB1 bacterium]|nr:hypothetical protein [candidate division KSB1 bacterium]
MSKEEKHIILGIHITDRVKRVQHIQELLTEYGCFIKTRLGLHEASPEYCSPNGLLILDMLDYESKPRELRDALSKIEGIEVKEMVFTH